MEQNENGKKERKDHFRKRNGTKRVANAWHVRRPDVIDSFDYDFNYQEETEIQFEISAATNSRFKGKDNDKNIHFGVPCVRFIHLISFDHSIVVDTKEK